MRTRSREILLYYFYQKTLNSQSFNDFLNHFELKDQIDLNFCKEIIEKESVLKDKILKAIAKKSLKWKINRISSIDFCLISIGILEIFFISNKTEKAIVIDDLIEISKKYSSFDSYRFINGILDNIEEIDFN